MKLTLVGCENYLNEYKSQSLFDFLNLPEGLDKSTLTNSLILSAGEFEVLYADPVFLRNMIGVWSDKHQMTFNKWMAALTTEYSPLENYDRYEDTTDDGDVTLGSGSDTNGTSENSVNAYDASDYSNLGKNESESHTTNRGTDTNHNRRVSHIHGNIGVTTSQQMLSAELEINAWNVYDHIIDLFKDEFLILVY